MNSKKIRITGGILVGLIWAALTLTAWFRPAQDMSMTERRKLAQFPEFSAETVLNGKFMEKFETYTLDQFPLRDSFRQVKAAFSYKVLGQKDNNGIYLTQGHGAKLEYPLKEQSVLKAVDKFSHIYKKYLAGKGGRIVFSLVPDKGYYLAEQNGYLAMDYEKLVSLLRDNLTWADYVDLTGSLTIDDYYTTDTHWRQEKLIPVAKKLADALRVPGPRPEDFRMESLERPFYGVYYGQAALPMPSETLYYLTNQTLEYCVVTSFETGKTSKVYDLTKEWGRDPYDVFLSGPVSIQTIENAHAPQRELLVFRDSFGSSLVPLLSQDYSKITLIDLRDVPADYLDQFIDFQGQDVLMLYSPLILNNSALLK